ncbi:DUF7033 domain-containing protein, partial [Salinimicrobium oceani]|nr:hypothetical protein [Salinimicrobium oceani]
LPFDIFAASFYLLSRYEEYLPHVKDKEGRFQASESLAFQQDFLELPVIDIWAVRFRKILKEKFPNHVFQEREFSANSVITVTEAFCYRKKGIVRVVLGLLVDLLQLRPKHVLHRLQVMLKFRKDPYDVYSRLIRLLKKHKVEMKFMFQVSDFSTYDRNIN